MCEEEERVARCWMMDFCFRSVCSSFRHTNREKFNQNIRLYEAVVDDECELQDDQQKKRTICCFLSRIMDGKNLEVHYDPSDRVTPLMSAVKVWEYLSDAVDDTALYENVRHLLFIQSVSVCLEKGNTQLAEDALQWLEKEAALPQKLQRKLCTVVTKKNVYDQLLTSFSYSRLLDSINTFLDKFLEKHPSDFLLQSASKVVQARKERAEREETEQDGLEPNSRSRTAEIFTKTEANGVSAELNLRPKKKLFSTKTLQPWKPETAKKPLHLPRRTSTLRVSRRSFKSSSPRDAEREIPKYKTKRKWTWEEDKNLRSGVKRYGEGKWSDILKGYQFEGRTSVMLKDRWRTMKKLGKTF